MRQFVFALCVLTSLAHEDDGCPYRRPWNYQSDWIRKIAESQYRECQALWVIGNVDQGGLGSDLHIWTANLACKN